MLLTPPEFLEQLQNLFISARSKGNIQVTQKSYNGIDKPEPKISTSSSNKNPRKRKLEEPLVSNKVLIRAKTDKSKISTVVDKDALLEFQVAYCKLLRNSMDGLKKRDRKKRTKKATKPSESKASTSK